jgi:hAT family C-terminal dimerisation region
MAKDFLGVPGLLLVYFLFYYYLMIFINVKIYLIATSAPSERIFSSVADVITYDRASLSLETVRAVMCLKHWYKSGLLD